MNINSSSITPQPPSVGTLIAFHSIRESLDLATPHIRFFTYQWTENPETMNDGLLRGFLALGVFSIESFILLLGVFVTFQRWQVRESP